MNSEILLIVLPVFLVIALGFSLKRTGLLKTGFLYDLNRLIYYIALPSLLFFKISKADFSASYNPKLLIVLVLSTVVTFLVSYGYGKMRGYKPPVLGAFCQGAFRGNLAYIGLAIIYNGYGEEGLAVAGILLGFLVPLFNFLSVIALVIPQREQLHQMGALHWVKQIVYNPLILASFCGIIWSYYELPLPHVVERALGILTGMALPMALLAIGASFSLKKLRGDILIASQSVFLKIVFLPALSAIILVCLGVSGQELAIGVLLAGTPTAAAAYIMAQQLKSDAEISGTIIMLSTLCSMLSYTLILSLLHLVERGLG